MKFKYTVASTPDGPLLDPRGRHVKRPVILLTLTDKKSSVFDTLAVIDSGADTTTVNIQYAEALGIQIDRSKHREIIGIGSGRVNVCQGVFPFKIKELGINMEVPAWYVDSDNVNILLGQEVFFDSFRIKFEKDHDVFEVTAVDK